MSELESCPFCGNEGIQIRYQGGGLDWTIRCKVCGNKTGHHKQRDSAELAWNRRAPDPEKAELVEALRDLLGEAVILSRDYLKAFQTEPGDYCIQGWDKARWERALMAKEKAQALLRRIEGGK